MQTVQLLVYMMVLFVVQNLIYSDFSNNNKKKPYDYHYCIRKNNTNISK